MKKRSKRIYLFFAKKNNHFICDIYFFLLTAHDVEYFTLFNILENHPPNLLKYVFLRRDN